jgi:hypothetical protein
MKESSIQVPATDITLTEVDISTAATMPSDLSPTVCMPPALYQTAFPAI